MSFSGTSGEARSETLTIWQSLAFRLVCISVIVKVATNMIVKVSLNMIVIRVRANNL